MLRTAAVRRPVPALAVALLALGLAGCGGDPSTTSSRGGTSSAGSTSGSASGSASGSVGSPTGSPGASGASRSPGTTTLATSTTSGGTGSDGGAAGATGSKAPVPWETGRATLPATLPSSPPGRAALTVLLDDGFGVRTTWKLTCDPAGGTHPEPSRACGVLGAEGLEALPPSPQDAICTQQYGGPQKAKITGTWRGNTVSSEISRENGCEIARWTALLGLLPPAGELS